jgi:hypothetical protein
MPGRSGFVVRNLRDLPESALACIQSVEQTTTIDAAGNTVIKQRLKLFDRLKALQIAGEHIDIRAFVQQHRASSERRGCKPSAQECSRRWLGHSLAHQATKSEDSRLLMYVGPE